MKRLALAALLFALPTGEASASVVTARPVLIGAPGEANVVSAERAVVLT